METLDRKQFTFHLKTNHEKWQKVAKHEDHRPTGKAVVGNGHDTGPIEALAVQASRHEGDSDMLCIKSKSNKFAQGETKHQW